MNKTQGTTVGAVLVAALLFRGAGNEFLGSGESGKEKATAQTSGQVMNGGEGSWIGIRENEQENDDVPYSEASPPASRGEHLVCADTPVRIASTPPPQRTTHKPHSRRSLQKCKY